MLIFTLKEKLDALGISETAFAERENIRRGTIHAICNNTAKQVSVKVIDKICNALDCTPGELMKFSPEADKK